MFDHNTLPYLSILMFFLNKCRCKTVMYTGTHVPEYRVNLAWQNNQIQVAYLFLFVFMTKAFQRHLRNA